MHSVSALSSRRRTEATRALAVEFPQQLNSYPASRNNTKAQKSSMRGNRPRSLLRQRKTVGTGTQQDRTTPRSAARTGRARALAEEWSRARHRVAGTHTHARALVHAHAVEAAARRNREERRGATQLLRAGKSRSLSSLSSTFSSTFSGHPWTSFLELRTDFSPHSPAVFCVPGRQSASGAAGDKRSREGWW